MLLIPPPTAPLLPLKRKQGYKTEVCHGLMLTNTRVLAAMRILMARSDAALKLVLLLTVTE